VFLRAKWYHRQLVVTIDAHASVDLSIVRGCPYRDAKLPHARRRGRVTIAG